jgi:hypothetical protein
VAEIKGGDKLNAALAAIAAKLKDGARVKVGFINGATYPDGKGTPVAMVAAIQNYGAPRAGIPPRPFFTNMVKEKSAEWPAAIEANLRETNYDTETTLNRVGQMIESQLQDSIINTYAPALSPVTVMLRGMRKNNPDLKVTGKTVGQAAQRVEDGKTNYGASTKPLVDTGVMLREITSQVTKD